MEVNDPKAVHRTPVSDSLDGFVVHVGDLLGGQGEVGLGGCGGFFMLAWANSTAFWRLPKAL